MDVDRDLLERAAVWLEQAATRARSMGCDEEADSCAEHADTILARLSTPAAEVRVDMRTFKEHRDPHTGELLFTQDNIVLPRAGRIYTAAFEAAGRAAFTTGVFWESVRAAHAAGLRAVIVATLAPIVEARRKVLAALDAVKAAPLYERHRRITAVHDAECEMDALLDTLAGLSNG